MEACGASHHRARETQKTGHDVVMLPAQHVRAYQRCWKYDRVVDMDIRAFFDSMDHDLLMRAVRKHTSSRWVLLYIGRWLKAPVQLQDGTVQPRDRGTPQGGVISPLLANLFLHYAFDLWMKRTHPDKPFERYADDVIVHCRSLDASGSLMREIDQRLSDVWADPAPRENKSRLLQGQEQEGRLSGYQI